MVKNMIEMTIPIYSKELENLFNTKDSNGVPIIYRAFSRISSLYNLTLNSNDNARYELFRILNSLEKLDSTISSQINDYKSFIKKNKFTTTPKLEVQVILTNSVVGQFINSLENTNTCYLFAMISMYKTGKKFNDRLINKYIKSLKKIVYDTAYINIKNVLTTELTDLQLNNLKYSYGYSVLPDPYKKKQLI
jgi:uncharacterized protein YbgA (DUF1722 family)